MRTLLGLAVVFCVGVGGCEGNGQRPKEPGAAVAGREASSAEVEASVKRGHEAFGRQDYGAAVREYEKSVGAGADAPLVHFRYGYALHVTGRPGEALDHHIAATRIENRALRIDALYNAACACAMLGRKGEALEWLGKAVEAGFKDVEQVRKDSDLGSLRGDSEFQRLVRAMQRSEDQPR